MTEKKKKVVTDLEREAKKRRKKCKERDRQSFAPEVSEEETGDR